VLREKLLRARISLRETQFDFQKTDRRRGFMRCQALLAEYASDDDFCARFRNDISVVLVDTARWHAENQQPLALEPLVKYAKLMECDTDPILKVAGAWAYAATRSACRIQIQGLARVCEVVTLSAAIAKAGGRVSDELWRFPELDLRGDAVDESQDVIPSLAVRAHAEVDLKESGRLASVKTIVDLCAKLEFCKESFYADFWKNFQPWYEGLESDTNKQTSAVEWAIAFCEQMKVDLPKWMMKKDHIEALQKLQDALMHDDEKILREAVVFAKQADYKNEAKLVTLYDQSMAKLKVLKRLPSGWEVDEMVGDSATEQMFMQADLSSPLVTSLFQKYFDDTKASIKTRDRSGDVPAGFIVEKVVSVMNAESWGSYLKRRDEIQERCKRFSGAAPCSDETWAGWSGKIAGGRRAQEICEACKVPPLEQGANEFLFFHGTKPDAADLIAKNHFDMSFACKTGLFGAGLYFGENSSKSDEYSKPNAAMSYPMIIARVTLGRVNYVPHADPVKDPGREKMEQSCLRGEYNCVLGDRKKARGTYREFIIYDHYQVYPHFIVWYKRI